MSEAMEIANVISGVFLVIGAAITLIGSLGLLSLRSFFERVHAPTLGTTLGAACVAIASMIHSSALDARWVTHEILILAFVTATNPITLMILVRAAVIRGASEKQVSQSGRLEDDRR